MPVTLVEISRKNILGFIRLDVSPEQRGAGLVAPNAATIAQYHYEPGAWMRGLVAEGKPVGLMAMVDLEAPGAEKEEGDPDDAAYLWRLLIDVAHQGKGYGTAAVHLAFAQARTMGRSVLAVSVVETENSAMPFYKGLGFAPTGRVVDDEIELTAPLS